MKRNLIYVLAVVAVAVFVYLMMGGPMVAPSQKAAVQFVTLLNEKKYDEAGTMISEHLPEDKKDFKLLWMRAMDKWGEPAKFNPIEEVDGQTVIPHPNASQSKRVEFEVRGYNSNGYLAIFIAPENGGWKVFDYALN
ncbi:MAG: hypothetical protein HUU60_11750 [Armatimonadetes bacterium]|nr:hypothetical protein [Armatimonadota bacterium]